MAQRFPMPVIHGADVHSKRGGDLFPRLSVDVSAAQHDLISGVADGRDRFVDLFFQRNQRVDLRVDPVLISDNALDLRYKRGVSVHGRLHLVAIPRRGQSKGDLA